MHRKYVLLKVDNIEITRANCGRQLIGVSNGVANGVSDNVSLIQV